MKKLILLTAIILCKTLFAQEGMTISISQDVKLATIGDKKRGYDAFTTNVTAKLLLQDDSGLSGGITYEYADLQERYQRVFMYFGQGFDVLNMNLLFTGGYGLIIREGKTNISYDADLILNIPLNERFYLNLNTQLVRRNDLETPAFKISGFVGIAYTILKK